MTDQHPNFIQSYFHGTKGDLKIGAQLALGDGPGRIYWEPEDAIENDPNLTDKKFPGNPRTRN